MLAIAQSGYNYHYLNWIPSERGPLITTYGSLELEKDSGDNYEHYFYNVLEKIFNVVDNGEPICTFSMDRQNVLISSCFAEDNRQELIDWHFSQVLDEKTVDAFDYYHVSMAAESGQLLNIAIPKDLRQSFRTNMRLLKSKLNGLSLGIFSAEAGARHWLQADKLESYIIWKVGKNKNDELLYLKDGSLCSYFSFHRFGKKSKMLWQYGDNIIADSILDEILSVQDGKFKKFSSAEKVFIYTTEGNTKDVKSFHQMGMENLVLLNPLTILETVEEEKINEFNTLPLAETGNAFGGVDV